MPKMSPEILCIGKISVKLQKANLTSAKLDRTEQLMGMSIVRMTNYSCFKLIQYIRLKLAHYK